MWTPQAREAAARARRLKSKPRTLTREEYTKLGKRAAKAKGKKTWPQRVDDQAKRHGSRWPEGVRKPYERTGEPSTRAERRERAKKGFGGHFRKKRK